MVFIKTPKSGIYYRIWKSGLRMGIDKRRSLLIKFTIKNNAAYNTAYKMYLLIEITFQIGNEEFKQENETIFTVALRLNCC